MCHLVMRMGISEPQHQGGPKRQGDASWSKVPPLPASQPLAAPAPDPMGTLVGCNPAGLQTALAMRQSARVTMMADWRGMLDISSNMGTDQIQAGGTSVSEATRSEGGI